ncbi:MAG: hypothetical protein EU541_07830 [Promethearchaeota archaeon]|nr:MAG: hypothetical protein EU541_07830 [Candidatus Lokiarchaeota archaeon]
MSTKKMIHKEWLLKHKIELEVSLIIGIISSFLVIWGFLFGYRLQAILYSPLITPEEWCNIQPCISINILRYTLTIVKPSSSFIVYFLGFQTTIIGIYLLLSRNGQKSRLWWGIALILWGLGAIFAGTSYQAFSYEIKCAGKNFCIWTSWWEIMYLIFTVGSVEAMLIAQSYACLPSKYRKICWVYSFGVFLIYIVMILIGAYLPFQFLISFELMILFLTPNIIFFLGLNIFRYIKNKNPMDKGLIMIWILLIIIIGVYFLYLIFGITEILWELGIWFSENDVLHIGLIIWMLYVLVAIRKYLIDLKKRSLK